MELFKHTLYINLEERKDRLAQVQGELAAMGIEGERFNAVKTKTGAVGCTMSHIRCLQLAKERGYEQVFICEDDIVFTDPELFKTNLERFYDNDEFVWDVLFVSGNNGPPFFVVSDYCSRVWNCQTTAGYIVKRSYYDTLLANFKEGLQFLLREPTKPMLYAIDMYWKRLQAQDYWYIITPLTVIQRPGFSDVENREVDYTKLILDFEKPWLKPKATV